MSLLLDDTGTAQAAYGYTAYGEVDGGLTKELNPNTRGDPNDTTHERDPLNSYRYSDKRMDTGSAVPTGEKTGSLPPFR